jgi:hypothetical protein
MDRHDLLEAIKAAHEPEPVALDDVLRATVDLRFGSCSVSMMSNRSRRSRRSSSARWTSALSFRQVAGFNGRGRASEGLSYRQRLKNFVLLIFFCNVLRLFL